jgi:hypothetical protein
MPAFIREDELLFNTDEQHGSRDVSSRYFKGQHRHCQSLKMVTLAKLMFYDASSRTTNRKHHEI